MPTHTFDLSKQISELLLEYGDMINKKVDETLPYVTEKTVEFLQTDSRVPKRTGDYRKGWRAKEWKASTLYKGVTVYNATDWQITHLLENGHAKRDGTGWVDAVPHIKYANEFAQETLVKTIKSEIEGI